MIRKRRIQPFQRKPKTLGLIDFSMSNYYDYPLTDDFIFEEIKPPHGSCTSIIHTSDISMLFNQQRLDKMSAEMLSSYLDGLSVNSNSLQSLRRSMSDDQLISGIKSRFVQSKSELQSYSMELLSRYRSSLIPPPDSTTTTTTTAAATTVEKTE